MIYNKVSGELLSVDVLQPTRFGGAMRVFQIIEYGVLKRYITAPDTIGSHYIGIQFPKYNRFPNEPVILSLYHGGVTNVTFINPQEPEYII